MTSAGPRIAAPPRSQEVVTVVRSIDDFMRAAAIRSIVYIGDQDCPYDEEFDGNDLCGLHLLGWVKGEPAASLRVRFFADFAKLERLAVRPEYRRSSIAASLVRHALRLVALKGYRKAYGHARQGLEPFWARFGAMPMGPAGGFTFSGHHYTEMLLDLPVAEGAIKLGSDPMLINRPEGAWDRPGILEAVPQEVTYQAESKSPADGWSRDVQQAWSVWKGAAGGMREPDVAWIGPDSKVVEALEERGSTGRRHRRAAAHAHGLRRLLSSLRGGRRKLVHGAHMPQKRKTPPLRAGFLYLGKCRQLQTLTRRMTTVSSSTTCRTLRTWQTC